MTTREKGFVFARLLDTTPDEEAEECFIHKTTVPTELWDTLEPGHAITCKVQETSKGLRGWDISAGSDADQLVVDADEEERQEQERQEREEKRQQEERQQDTRGNR